MAHKQEHTPTPWEVYSGMIQTVAKHKYTPNSPESFTIPICHMDRKPGNGTSPVERDENAHFIVRAVNSFNAIREALEDCITDDGAFCMTHDDAQVLKQRIRVINTIAKVVLNLT